MIKDKRLLRPVLVLLVISAMIYLLQILIFKDPGTTAFYIFQDMAFLPFTIAIATLVVGEVLSAREKEERVEKTRMLTSTFFSEVGAPIMFAMLEKAEIGEAGRKVVEGNFKTEEIESLKEEIHRSKLQVNLDEELYANAEKIIAENQTALLVLSSNPMLMDHECFTELLWGLFHLIDEFRLRGHFEKLSETDRKHMAHDFEEILKLLLMNWMTNDEYMRRFYPNFYGAARRKIAQNMERMHRANS